MRSFQRSSYSQADTIRNRSIWLSACLSLGFLVVISRLFYWQIIRASDLQAEADAQYERSIKQQGIRGSILTSDGHVLVSNQQVYRLFAEPYRLEKSSLEIATTLAPLILSDKPQYKEASSSAVRAEMEQKLVGEISSKLSQKNRKWINLEETISQDTKKAIEQLDLGVVGFDPYYQRYYPEASLAAHITGFVGKDESGKDLGYFGLEGALEKELKARETTFTIATDALGMQVFGNTNRPNLSNEGRTIVTTIRRDIQFLAESYLQQGLEQYGAKSGEVVILEPKTGKILALASLPAYDQYSFFQHDPILYKNPSLATTYEPGSTFKVLTVAAGIEEGKISPDTVCTKCSGPRTFGEYTIRTWNDTYRPNTTMTEGLANSDNTAMIFIAEPLGADNFANYLKKFGIGEKLNIELQEDTTTPFPQRWGPVELATTSFGQGISTNSLQLVRAISAIANGGVMMRPQIIEKVYDPLTGEEIINQPAELRRVVSHKTAQLTTQMMVQAASGGEAQWTRSRTHVIAGKTGTSQIAVKGSYDPDKTIASFIGFAPPENPQFIMLVKLVEPQSSPWAAETAAPLWYKIANRLFLLLNIPPDRQPDPSIAPESSEELTRERE